MNKLPNIAQIVQIQKYYNLDEGFEEIAPEFLNAEVNMVLSFHLSQLKFHRESIEKMLQEEYDRIISEEGVEGEQI